MPDLFARQLGRILVKVGVLEEPKLDEAMGLLEKDSSRTLSEVLIEGGYLTEADYLGALAIGARIPPIDLSRIEGQEEALKAVPQEVALQYLAVPLTRLGRVLTVALANPLDLIRRDDLSAVTRCELRPFVSTTASVKKAIERMYGSREEKGGGFLKGDAAEGRARKGADKLQSAPVATLAALLQEEDRDLQRRALLALVERRALDALPQMAALIKHRLAIVRLQAAEALFKLDSPAAYDALAAGLDDSESHIRIEVVRFLLRARDARRFDRLEKAFRDPDAGIRREILSMLQTYEGSERGSLLGIFLDDQDFFLRKKALDTLSTLPPEQAYLVFRRVVGDRNSVLRAQATAALLNYPDPQAVAGLIPVLGDSDDALRSRVWLRIDRVTSEELIRSVEDALDSVPESVVEERKSTLQGWMRRRARPQWWDAAGGDRKVRSRAALDLLEAESVEELQSFARQAFTTFSGPSLLHVIRGLGRLRRAEGSATLLEGLRHQRSMVRETVLRECLREDWVRGLDAELVRLGGDPDVQVRREALGGIISRRIPGWEFLVARSVGDEAAEIRRVGVEAMVGYEEGWVLDPLERAVADSDVAIAVMATKSLVTRGVKKASLAPAYARAFRESPEDPFRVKLAELLGGLKHAESLQDLGVAARKGGPLLRRTAAQAIVQIGAAGADEVLAGLKDTEDTNVLRIVAHTLGGKQDERAIIPLIRAIEECKGLASKTAEKLIRKYAQVEEPAFLIGALKYKRASVKRFAADRLRHCQDPAAIEPLLEAINEPSGEVQMAVIQALGNFTEGYPKVVEKIIEFVTWGETSVRQASVEVLGERKVLESVPVLIRVLGNVFLKQRAIEALKKIGDRKGFLAILRRKRREEEIEKQKDRIREMNEKRMPGRAGAKPRKQKKKVITDV